MEYILYNSFFFLLIWTFAVFFRKNALLSYVVSIWLVSSIIAVIIHALTPWTETNITLLPFIYFQICFLISLYPVCKFKDNVISSVQISNPILLDYFVLIISFLAIVPFIENIQHMLASYSGDTSVLSDIYNEKREVGFDTSSFVTWLSPWGKFSNSIIGKFYYLLPFLFFYYLTLKEVKYYVLIGLGLAVVNIVVFQLSLAGRTTLTFFILELILLFLIFYKHIPKKRSKIMVLVVSLFLFCAFLYLLILTLARKEGAGYTFSTTEYVIFYLGRGVLNFNNDVWNIQQYTNGDNSFSFFKYITGFPTFTDLIEHREYWNYSKLGIDIRLFHTYIGDWFIDLGRIGTLIFISCFSSVMILLLRVRSRFKLTSLFLFHQYTKIIICGWAIYPLQLFNATFNLFICLFILHILTSGKRIYFKRKYK